MCWRFLLFFLLLSVFSNAQEDTLSIPETPAEFPGGPAAMRAYLDSNLVYPQLAQELGLQGKCHLSFTISTEGKVTDIKILRGVPDCPECDKEAIRLFRSMPAWIPATINGKPVASTYRVACMFPHVSDQQASARKL